jgi:hypothetical protein
MTAVETMPTFNHSTIEFAFKVLSFQVAFKQQARHVSTNSNA